MQTHISFEELDDFVQLVQISKWQHKLSISFSDVVLSLEMITTVCQAIKQSIKRVDHDCQIHLEIDCKNSQLSDESFRKIFAEATPNVMRKSGRICIDKLCLSGNSIGAETIRDICQIISLNKEAKYRYKFQHAISAGLIDLSFNDIREIDVVESFFKCIHDAGTEKFVFVKLSGNYLEPIKIFREKATNDWSKRFGLSIITEIDESDSSLSTGNDSQQSTSVCTKSKCVNKCTLHLTSDSLEEQRQQSDSTPGASQDVSGYLTPPAATPSIEDMTKALMEGLKISPGIETAGPPKLHRDNQEKAASVLEQFMKNSGPKSSSTSSSNIVSQARVAASNGSAEDISKSLLNLLHSSAVNKIRGGDEVFQTPISGAAAPGSSVQATPMTPNVLSFFNAAAAAGGPVTSSSSGRKQTPPVQKNEYTIVRVPLRVFTPFTGATPLCGLELRIDPMGYRVVRVTEKPGQDGNIREGDIITAIDGDVLIGSHVGLSATNDLDREKTIRTNFGRKVRDGVMVTIQRPSSVSGSDLHPDPSTVVERKLDFGLMLLGAGIDWKNLVGKLPMAVQQAKVVCQSFGIEGKLESIPNVDDPNATPFLTLKGPAGLVDKAMRQFCVVIVKGALLQQQQQNVLGVQS